MWRIWDCKAASTSSRDSASAVTVLSNNNSRFDSHSENIPKTGAPAAGVLVTLGWVMTHTPAARHVGSYTHEPADCEASPSAITII